MNKPKPPVTTEELRIRIARSTSFRNMHQCALDAADALDAAERTIETLTKFAKKVDGIRNNIVGAQNFNWSRDAYPLVAALAEAGYPGEGYDKSRHRIVTYISEIERLEQQLATMTARLDAIREAADLYEEVHGFRDEEGRNLRAALASVEADDNSTGIPELDAVLNALASDEPKTGG